MISPRTKPGPHLERLSPSPFYLPCRTPTPLFPLVPRGLGGEAVAVETLWHCLSTEEKARVYFNKHPEAHNSLFRVLGPSLPAELPCLCIPHCSFMWRLLAKP